MLMETKMVSHRCLRALIISPTRELVSTVYITYHVYTSSFVQFGLRYVGCYVLHGTQLKIVQVVTSLLVEQ